MRRDEKQSPEEILDEKIDRLHKRREWRHFFVECVIFAAVIYVLFHYVIGIAFVSGISMEPSLKNGELVFFYRLDSEYREDDVVIVHRGDNLEYIKRVAAGGGSLVELSEAGELLVDGVPEQNPPRGAETLPVSDKVSFPYEVPEGSYFVLGDNRVNSRDSRTFGAVPEEKITGRVFCRMGIVS